jgi:ATP-dependent Clp protease ATP-binding subunit ClpA
MPGLSDYTFSDDFKHAVGIAQSVAKEYSNDKISPAHILKALLHKDIGLRPLIEEMDKDYYYIEEWADVRVETYPKATKLQENPPADDALKAVFTEAESIRLKTSKDQIDPVCVFASLCTPGVGFSFEQLKTFPVRPDEILKNIVAKTDFENVIAGAVAADGAPSGTQKQNALMKFCIDVTADARAGKLDPVIGRDKEIRMMAEILGRRSRPNVIVIGDPGVGKTAVINGFVQQIAEDKMSRNLAGARVFELDYGSLIAGASYKGEVEDRLKNIIKEIKQFDKAILFIDDIHTVLDKSGGASGAANLLKPELARGEITIIGATSIDNYTKFIESDEAFKRSFETIKIEEPNLETAGRMLQRIIPIYEQHHNLSVGNEVIHEAIRLSKRYLKERSLPDAAISLIDTAMAVVRMAGETKVEDIEAIKQQLELLVKNEKGSNEAELLNDLQWLHLQLKDKISEVLFAMIEDDADLSKITSSEELIVALRALLEKLTGIIGTPKSELEKTDLAAIVSHKIGIPLGKVQTQERERLLNTEEYLKQRVVGQDHAIRTITESILESRSGLSKAGQPIGSFFFLGPTGTGKTELAKTLAEFLFQEESSMIRFDMSEFKEEHSAALLYGAPPGYVGYEEGGLLVNKIRQQPYAVVLFDEIEKAHASVFDIFLQIMDEGKLHDRLGKEGDFSNALVIFTSNIGSQMIVDSFDKGVIPKSNEMMDAMSNYFRPEFLGRLTEIVPFAPISKEIVIKIFEIQLKGLHKMLDNIGIKLEISPEAKEELAYSGFTPKYGARPLLGIIRNQLRRPLSKKIIANEICKGNTVQITLNDKKELIWNVVI